jgi:hypothetical protein
MKDAKLAIEQGNLMVLNSEQKKSVTMRKAALSYLPNGELLDGAQVQFKNNLMDATLGIIFLKKQSISQTRLSVLMRFMALQVQRTLLLSPDLSSRSRR